MSARRMRRLSLVAAAAAALSPQPAAAHATLVRSSPRDAAVLGAAPGTVRLLFDDVIRPAAGNEVVRNGRGSVLRAAPLVDRGGRELVLRLRPRLPDGDYSVRWRVLSDDGHFVSGVLAFAVGAGRAPPQSVLRAASGDPSARDLAARWAMLAGLLASAGAVAFAYGVFRPALRRLPRDERERLERAECGPFGALVAGGCLLFAAGGASFIDRGGWGTRFGAALDVGLVAALVGATCAGISLVDRSFRLPAAAAALGIAAVPSFAGHALDPGVPRPNVAVDLLHVGAAAVWLGMLLGLVLVLPRAARAGAGTALSTAVARRASALALASVLVLGATGIFRAVFELHSLDQLWTTGYGRALLVKTALLLALTALGWLNRSRLLPAAAFTRLGRSVSVELVLFAGAVVAVAFLTLLRPGRDVPRARAAAPAQEQPQPPPPPPVGAIVLAQEAGSRAVAIAVRPGRVTATVLAPSGGGEDGLRVSLNGKAARPCGHGCYAAQVPSAGRVDVAIDGRTVVFRLPRTARPADALVRRATRVFEDLRSVVYRESLASSPADRIVTSWRLQAPNRLAYAISDGVQAVVIGGTRWDRTGNGPWQKSQISPLRVPQATWGTYVLDAHVLSEAGPVAVVSWANPGIPAWFTVRFDRRTLRPLDLQMTAAAHFMRQRYLSFNRSPRIRPPR